MRKERFVVKMIKNINVKYKSSPHRYFRSLQDIQNLDD